MLTKVIKSGFTGVVYIYMALFITRLFYFFQYESRKKVLISKHSIRVELMTKVGPLMH